MGNSRKSSTHLRRVGLFGRVYGLCYLIFMGLLIIFQPRMRASNWHGWQLVSWGLGAMATALVVSGISLLGWIFMRHHASRSIGGFSRQAVRAAGVWDQELDG